jgi:hypothetical protein
MPGTLWTKKAKLGRKGRNEERAKYIKRNKGYGKE